MALLQWFKIPAPALQIHGCQTQASQSLPPRLPQLQARVSWV